MNFSANLQERRKVLEKPVSFKICEAIGHWVFLAHFLVYLFHSQSLFPGVCTVNLISLPSPWFPNPLVSSISWNRRHREEDNAIRNILSGQSFFPTGYPLKTVLFSSTHCHFMASLFTARYLKMFMSLLSLKHTVNT